MTLPRNVPDGNFLGRRLCWNIAPVHKMAASSVFRGYGTFLNVKKATRG